VRANIAIYSNSELRYLPRSASRYVHKQYVTGTIDLAAITTLTSIL